MSSKPGTAVSNDKVSTNSPAPSGSKKATGSAGGSPPALKKKSVGRKKSATKKSTRKSATGKAAGKKQDSKAGGRNAADKKSTGTKKTAARKAASEKKTVARSRKRPGLATAATSPDAVAQNPPAANTDDPRSLAWMIAAANKALHAVRDNQAEKAFHLLNAQGADTAVPTETVEFLAYSASHADTPGATPGSEVSATGIAPPQPETAVTAVEDTPPPVAVTELTEEAGTTEAVAEDQSADSALAQVVKQTPEALETTAAGAEDPWPRDGDATTGQSEPVGKTPLPPLAAAPRQRVPLRMMAGAVALVLAVMIGYGFLADEDEVVVPVADLPGDHAPITEPGRPPISTVPATAGATQRNPVKAGEPVPTATTTDAVAAAYETPAAVDHSVQAATESGTKAAAPAGPAVVPREQPVATAIAEGTTAGLPPDESLVPQQAATAAPQPVSEPVSRPETEPASTTASRTTAPVARQPVYRGPGYGYYPPGWRQPGYRYPAQ